MSWLLHIALLYVVAGLGVLVGIGISADVKRFLNGRQKAGQRASECLGRALH